MFSYQQQYSQPGDQSSLNDGDGGSKRNLFRNIMPVSVRMMVQHKMEDGPFQICGVNVGLVVMVAQVRQIEKGDLSTSYLIEDDTGRMEAIHYHEETTPVAKPNTFVKITGALKPGRDRNMVTVYRLDSIRDMNEVVAHQLELTATPLRISRLQTLAATLAHASLMGGTGKNQYPLIGGSVGAAGDRSTVISNHKRPNMFCPSFAQPSKPGAATLLRSIKSSLTDIGISRQQLYNMHRIDLGQDGVNELLEYLVMEGHVYTTTDEDHYKSTDA